MVTTAAGLASTGSANGSFADGDADTAKFNTPTEVFADNDGNIYVGDTYNQRIRKISNGEVTTVAGNGTAGLVNGIDTAAEFKSPRGIVIGGSGNNLFVCDNSNHVIRKILLYVQSGIEAVHQKNDFVLTPNPAAEMITVHFPDNKFMNATVRITNLTGQTVWVSLLSEKHFSGNDFSIDVSNLLPGNYFLRMDGAGQMPTTEMFEIIR